VGPKVNASNCQIFLQLQIVLAGRPKLRRLDCISNDLKSVGVKEVKKAEDICRGHHSEGGTWLNHKDCIPMKKNGVAIWFMDQEGSISQGSEGQSHRG
jgi:hypothetical protein